ncbi:MAG: DNA polymerase III subunit delta' [bacterium]
MIVQQYPWLELAQQQLLESYLTDNLGHAYLLHGPAGSAKNELSNWFAQLLLCKEKDQKQACGICNSCRFFKAETHPDSLEIVPEKNTIKIDTIRVLSQWCSQSSALSGLRVVMIRQAEKMNHAAANALLKTLEEPGAMLKLILTSDDANRLPATILSRCQHVKIAAATDQQALQYLSTSQRNDEDKKIALSACGGSPVLAMDFLDSEEFAVFRELGLFLQRLSQHDEDWILQSQKLSKFEPQLVLSWLATWTRHWTVMQVSKNTSLTNGADKENLFRLYDQCINNTYDLNFSIRPQGLYETFFVAWIACFRR